MQRKFGLTGFGLILVLALCMSCKPSISTNSPTFKPPPSTTKSAATTTLAANPLSADMPKYGGRLTIIAPTEITGFDLTTTPVNGATIPLTNGTLVGGDWAKGPAGTNEVSWTNTGYYGLAFERGNLAESWEIPEPGKTVFHIRKGVHFALDPNNEASRLMNGREITADDVVSTFRRSCTVPTAFVRVAAPLLARTSTFTATDKYTLTMTNPEDSYSGFNLFTLGIGTRQMAPEVIQKYGSQTDWHNSVGTGPFILTDFVSGSQATLKRNPNYWDKDQAGAGKGNQLPYLDGISLLIITDVSTQLAAVRTAKVDLSPLLTPDDAKSLMKSNPELLNNTLLPDSSRVIGMRLDKSDLPYQDKRVRQALMMATNFDAIKTQLYGGDAETLVWPVASQNAPDVIDPLDKMPQAVQALYRYNTDGAKRLLADAGYPGGFKASVVCTSSSSDVDAMSVVAAMWSQIGVSLQIQPTETVAYQSISSGRSYPNMIYGMALGSGNWPILTDFRGTPMFNLSRYDDPPGTDPKVEAAYAVISKEVYTNERHARQLFKEFVPYILEQAPVIPLPNPHQYVFWQRWLKNYHGEVTVDYSMGNVWTTWVWIDQAQKAQLTGR